MKWKVGDKLKAECISCGRDEVWRIESITHEEYSDGIFKAYNLTSVKNCLSDNGIGTSVKDVPEATQFYKKI